MCVHIHVREGGGVGEEVKYCECNPPYANVWKIHAT